MTTWTKNDNNIALSNQNVSTTADSWNWLYRCLPRALPNGDSVTQEKINFAWVTPVAAANANINNSIHDD